MMIVSRHAEIRCNQRGIPNSLLLTAFDIGTFVDDQTIWVSNKDIKNSTVTPQKKDRLCNLVVHCVGEVVKTVYRASPKQARCFAKSSRK